MARLRVSPFGDESQALWDATLEEAADNHWMTGPFSVEQIHEQFDGQPWIPVRRFGVLQSSGDRVKLRPIDDFAENKVNSAYGYSDKLDLRTLDQMVWMTVAITRALKLGHFCFCRSDGVKLQGKVHPGYLRDGAGQAIAHGFGSGFSVQTVCYTEGVSTTVCYHPQRSCGWVLQVFHWERPPLWQLLPVWSISIGLRDFSMQ